MIAAYLEIRDGKIKKSSLEALSEARRRAGELGLETAAVLVGASVAGLAPSAFALGAAKVYAVENPALADYSSQAYAVALAGFAAAAKPAALFFAATAMGKDLAPRVAARLGAGLACDCTKVAVKDGALEFTRPIYAGKAFLTLRLKTAPQLATLRPNVFPLGEAAAASGETVRMDAVHPGRRGQRPRRRGPEGGERGDRRHRSRGRRLGRPRAQGPRGLRPSTRPGRRLPPGRGGRLALGRRLRLDRPPAPGRPDGQDRLAAALRGRRHLRRDPAPGRDVVLQGHRRHQQGPRGADLQGRGLRHRRRPLRSGAEAHGRAEEGLKD